MFDSFRPSRREVLLGAVASAAMLATAGRGSFVAAADNLADLTGTEAVDALRSGRITATGYVEALLDRAERVRDLNLFISMDPAQTLAAAGAIDQRRAEAGLLHGLPFAVKDNMNTVDMPTSGGTPSLRGFVPNANAPVVQALLDANGILLGKLNMHELAFGITNNNAAYGAVGNPYDPTLIPGGSSGGTGAAVAARVIPVGLGSDTGGSTRIPAALCGCVGFRPSLGRYPQAGVVPLSHSRDTVGPMGRTVDDVILFDRICGSPAETVPRVGLEGIRLGVPRSFFYENLDSELAVVIENSLATLADAGAELVEVDFANIAELNGAVSFPLVLYEVLRELSAYLFMSGSTMSVVELVDQVGGPGEKGILMSQMGPDAVPAAAYREALVVHRPILQRAYADYFRNNNLAAMVVPTTPLPARPIGQDETVELNGEQVPTFFTFIRNTDPPSNAGVPCLSVPVGLTAGGLPVGLEVVGPAMSDALVLGIGRAVEAVHGVLPPPRV